MAIDLPNPIAAYFEADRQKGAEAIARCFTEHAVVKDEGRTYTSREAIRRWKADSANKYSYAAETVAIGHDNGRIVVTRHLVGDFPGSPVDLRYFFVLQSDEIAELEIVP
ncbi:nuclear transport factor 2 family protein [Caenibius sp. WL]|uniref:nuclear transport factor 2 family protein n=1 Tax=Caenibius sp. WL TaxID=2872646 RepID=UPI001C99696C|nr:nuclear transport factor 2 family protein [Caenibius sp. WL]QZP07664.1 nuclear transport factor 2 family protein [Caenibius sp. WL]